MSASRHEVKLEGSKKKFVLYRLPPRQALKLDKRMSELILCSLGASKSADGSVGGLQVESLAGGLGKVLSTLSGDEFIELMTSLLSTTQVVFPDNAKQPSIQIDSEENFDKAFEGESPAKVYQLAFEVMRFNEFSPFALGEMLKNLGFGNVMKEMFSFNGPENPGTPDGN